MSMSRIYQLMKLNRLIKSPRPKFAGVLAMDLMKARHLFVRFDPVVACNLSCRMCFFSDTEYRKHNKGIFSKDEVDRLAAMFFPTTLQVVFGCGAEPTLYRDYPDLVKIAKSYGVPNVGLVSNGQLFTEANIRKLVGYGLDELMLSLHGVHRESYEKLMTGASYDKFHEVLETLDRVKKELGVSDPELRINYTVNSDNLQELRDFFKVFGKYDIARLQVRPMLDCGQTGYRRFDLRKFKSDYAEIVEALREECKARGTTLLAHMEFPKYKANRHAGKKTAMKTVAPALTAPASAVARQAAAGQDKGKRAQLSRNSEIYGSLALDSVLRFVSPQRVWRPDFDWRNEDYRAYCRRIGFRKSLLTAVFSNPEKLARKNPFRGRLALSYDVL